ncbi:protein of unknown function DUF721 [Gloeothece citriformis PCC 7424]|uniref:RNA-binding protein containing Zn ribbon n=1 Tax=Gloeothece citriformis (strain PCC 7424) TaxID=65393 RepID=B7K9T4_GLOC7|nr:DciA family protein [Gloeothece citriformis]ACK70052.1 protein of unknown function DUF721 [Gloeothece citriformis PCC 7424]
MSLESVSKIINFVEGQPGWEKVRLYRQVLQGWKSVVSPQVASNTRPLSINRQVLWVATSSSVWAQNLSLQRFSLLKKLNPLLPEPLKDIRFSPAGWNNSLQTDDKDSPAQANLEEQHPSFVGSDETVISLNNLRASNKDDLSLTFQRWAQNRQHRLQCLPLCPRCHCPTPAGELERWSICSCCATQQWST